MKGLLSNTKGGNIVRVNNAEKTEVSIIVKEIRLKDIGRKTHFVLRLMSYSPMSSFEINQKIHNKMTTHQAASIQGI